MKVESLEIPEVKMVTPPRLGDGRGYFSEVYNAQSFKAVGIDCNFVQDNESLSREKGTIRGLHYQSPPFAQAKLVRVIAGAILDVAVDARKASPTFGKWVSANLSAQNGAQLFVPRGFLHGFLTLESNTCVTYKVDNFYDRESDGTVRWNDPDLAIDWMIAPNEDCLSQKDANAPSWAEFSSPF